MSLSSESMLSIVSSRTETLCALISAVLVFFSQSVLGAVCANKLLSVYPNIERGTVGTKLPPGCLFFGESIGKCL